MSAELDAATDRQGSLEAEAVLLKGRIRTAADAGDLDETVRLYRRIGELRLELLAVRHVVARLTRHETRQYGYNSALTAAEHLLDVELATLGVQPDPGMRQVFG